MKTGVALLIGGLLVGGVVYVATKKKDEKVSDTPAITPGPSIPGLPEYVPQELVDAYTKCYSQGCSYEEYKQVQTALAGLLVQHPELAQSWNYFMQELQKKVPVQPPQLPEDFDIKKTYQTQVNTCWYYACNIEGVTQLADALNEIYFEHVLDHPNVATEVSNVMNELRYWYGLDVPDVWLEKYLNRSTAGRSTGACCAACAAGEPCEGCGETDEDEPEERGVG